jgi:hypothetical protein
MPRDKKINATKQVQRLLCDNRRSQAQVHQRISQLYSILNEEVTG